MGALIQAAGGVAGLLLMAQVAVTVGLIALLVVRELLHVAGPGGQRVAAFLGLPVNVFMFGFGIVAAVRLFR